MSNIDVDATKEQAEKAKLLPEPKGYRILCAVPQVEEEYEGGLIKADETKKVEEQTTVVLFVIKMGDQCYADKDRFPTGPWCKEGDFILTRPYSGTRVVIHGREFRIINDDTVEAVVDDPRGIRRA
jgi:co-chaperonin GroES (HSP10)|uniref:Co-chaperonin GroES n=1 Tax=uncultured virus TaxID=340016 RepID=A0A221S3B4_9VIRU|nr:co-chaperonin GroES [uncultured virus]ASN63441.1 co-chaperonin GroES [uncultured virus]